MHAQRGVDARDEHACSFQPLLTSHRRAERHCPRRLENPSREVTESTERGPNRCYSLTLLATRMYLPLSPGPVSKIPSSPAGVQGRLASDRWPGLRVVAMGVAHDCHAQVFGMCARTLESRLADGSGLVLRASMAHPCSPCSDHDSLHGLIWWGGKRRQVPLVNVLSTYPTAAKSHFKKIKITPAD